MSAIQGVLSGVITIILMVVFVGIWVWAWRPRHRKTFEELAELPLEDLTDSPEIPGGHGDGATRRDTLEQRPGAAPPAATPSVPAKPAAVAPPSAKDGRGQAESRKLGSCRQPSWRRGWQAGLQGEQSR